MGMSFGHLLVILVIVLVLFGAGRLPQVMSDLGKGLKSFKKSLNNDDDNSDSSK
jgi:sec-independent protein translocase protein TatA